VVQASKPTAVVTASGDRSIAIGGDAVYSLLVTGDNNTFFVGHYERLQDAYLDPQMLYRELGLDQFTGREWLVEKVDRFFARNSRGYLVIEADAGMGKSTFLAWLARQRGYITHFVRLMRDPNDIGSAMRNLNAQLIRAWDLDTYAAGGILPPAADRPEFLQEILAAAARQRDRLRPGEPIVLVVDGLNETTPVAGQNPLALPGQLPEGVYVIVSQRTVHVPLRLEVRREVVRIEANSVENQVDVREYLTARAAAEPIADRLRAVGTDPADFAEVLLAKSQGVWVYLHYVLADIAEARLNPDEIDQLPAGLWHYYGQYWHDWQRGHADRWSRLDLPLLSVIAAVAEPLPAALIAEFAGVADVTLAEELLDNDWRPFLQVDEDDDPVRYRPFHESLREFVRGSAPADDLTAAEASLARRLGHATRAAHARIADRYLTAWGGLTQGLPSLALGHDTNLDGGYGLRQVVGHLIGADRLDDVHVLLAVGRTDGSRVANLWFAAHRQIGMIGAYQRDVAAVLAAIRSQDGPLRDALQLRYTLFACSLNSIAEATPPALWALLVTQGRLSSREAIDEARRVPTAEDRAEALTSLIAAVAAPMREEVEREAIAAVRAVTDEFWRVGELLRLYPHVSPERRDSLLSVVRSLEDPYFQVVAYRILGLTEAIPSMTSPRSGHGHEQDLQSPSGMAAFSSFVEDYRRRRQLAAARLNSAGFLVAHRSARAAAGTAVPIFDSVERYWTAQLLTVAALDATPEKAASLAAEAAEVGQDIGYRPEAVGAWQAVGAALAGSGPTRDWGLTHLVPRLDNLVLRLALQLALTVPGDHGDAQVLEVLAEHDEKVRTLVLTEIAPVLATRGVAQATSLIDTVGDQAARARVLVAVADQAGVDAGHYAEAALSVVEADPGLPGRAGLLARTSRYLPVAAIRRAAAMAANWAEDDVRSSVLACLAVRLCELDAVADAVRVQADVAETWQADVRAALALAHLRLGEREAALRLVPGIPSVLRRVEILASAAIGPRGGDAAARVDEIAADADRLSRVAILARACIAGPARYRQDRCAALVADAQAIEDYHDRSVALAAVVGVLIAAGRPEETLDLCAQIPVDHLRGEALVEVSAASAALIPPIAAQASSMRDRQARTRVRMAVLQAADRQVVAAGAAAAAGPGPVGAPDSRTAGDLIRPLFDAALTDLATGPRDQFLAHFPSLLRIVARYGDSTVVGTVAGDLADAGQWWP
jgi:hypothetical protein